MVGLAHLIFDSWKRAILKLISKLFPFERVVILLPDRLEIVCREAKISQIDIPSIPPPYVTFDLCPVRPELIEASLSFEEQRSEDLSTDLIEGMSYSQTEDLDFQLDRTKPILDRLEMIFAETKINHINIPSISSPHITSDLCPVRPGLVE